LVRVMVGDCDRVAVLLLDWVCVCVGVVVRVAEGVFVCVIDCVVVNVCVGVSVSVDVSVDVTLCEGVGVLDRLGVPD
jgi:hypothetical protein